MLAGYQIINKVLQTRDFGIISQNGLEANQFSAYGEQFQFIVDHHKNNGNVPDMLTFQSYFPDFTFNEVYETDDYLLDRLYEENGYQKWAEILPTLNEKIKEDSRLAYDYLNEQMKSYLKPHTVCKGYDIIANAMDRYNAYVEKRDGVAKPTISSGLPELDDILGGWEPGDELIIVVGRTGSGKSWISEKFMTEAWKQGKRVGLYSGEMSSTSIGYRFDTLFGNIPNRCLFRGLPVDGYSEYINSLTEEETPFFIVTPKDLGGRPTVNKLRSFVENNNLDMLCVDQLSLMEDCHSAKNDLLRIKMGHIAEDLFLLSSEYKIPVLALAQANRDSLKKGNQDAPGLENISESDVIAHNSSKVISIRQVNNTMILDITKNRNGRTGGKLTYKIDLNSGYMVYQPTDGDGLSAEIWEKSVSDNVKSLEAGTSVNPF